MEWLQTNDAGAAYADTPGYEFWRMARYAKRHGMTQAEFDEFMQNPDFYQLEDPATYRWRRELAFSRCTYPVQPTQAQFDDFRDNPDFSRLEDAATFQRRRELAFSDCAAFRFDDYDPVQLAVEDADLTAVRQFLAAQAPADTRDREGRTPLFYAALESHEAIAKELIAAGADVNAKDHLEQTPLGFALRENQPNMVDLLLRAGADPHIRDVFGHSPLSRAGWINRAAASEALLQFDKGS